jgi:TatA/E family protein of Tat protein translocase
MFDLGTQELIVIFIVAFLVFGPKKLPELGRTLGKGMRELKSAMRGVRESLEEAGGDVTEELKDVQSELKDSVQKSLESQFDFKSKENKEDIKEAPKGEETESAVEEEKEKTETEKTEKEKTETEKTETEKTETDKDG